MILDKQNKERFLMYDPAYILAILAILSIGLVMVLSASMMEIGMAVNQNGEAGDAFYYLKRQAVFVVFGGVMALMASQVPMRLIEKYSLVLFIIGILLLLALMVPGIGVKIKGSTRWIEMVFFRFQPSELIKLFVIIYLAGFAVRKVDVMHVLQQSLLPVVLVMLVIGSLLMNQPDLSTFIVIASIAICMMWLAGINLSIFIVMIVGFSIFLYFYIGSEEYRKERLMSLINGPWADPNDSGYQVLMSLMSYANGGLTGVGLGGGWVKILLPEPFNDFIIAVIGEEFGLIGIAVVIGLIAYVVNKGFQIGKQAQFYERSFAALVAYGISIWIAIQSIVHIGVSLSVLPATGVNLPLMSYGGSSMVVTMLAVGIMLRIDYENRCVQKGIHV